MTTSRRRLALAAAVALALLAAGASFVLAPPPPVPRRQVDWESARAGPVDARRVYWVGHSLLDHRDVAVDGAPNVMEAVGDLAERAGVDYRAFAHTFFGAPLSVNWTGAARSFEREEPLALERRDELTSRGAAYDALVLAEALPIGPTLEAEAGAYYAQRFYCAAVRANPNVRIYVYAAWGDFTEPDAFVARLAADRPHHERLADEAAAARVPPPGRLAALAARAQEVERACHGPPILLVPVDAALRRLARALNERPEALRLADGRPLRLAALIANPRVGGALRHPDDPEDRVHPSALGSRFAAQVAFATLYRRAPPPIDRGLEPETAAEVARLVWQAVREEPRAGVR